MAILNTAIDNFRKVIASLSLLIVRDGYKRAMQWSVHAVKHGTVVLYVKQIQQKILKHAYRYM